MTPAELAQASTQPSTAEQSSSVRTLSEGGLTEGGLTAVAKAAEPTGGAVTPLDDSARAGNKTASIPTGAADAGGATYTGQATFYFVRPFDLFFLHPSSSAELTHSTVTATQ